MSESGFKISLKAAKLLVTRSFMAETCSCSSKRLGLGGGSRVATASGGAGLRPRQPSAGYASLITYMERWTLFMTSVRANHVFFVTAVQEKERRAQPGEGGLIGANYNLIDLPCY